MTKLDAILAPRALTVREIAEVLVPNLIVFGVTKRAFTFAHVWDVDGATNSTACEALGDIETTARQSVEQWLGDVATDGEPRFYQKAGLKDAIAKLLDASARLFATKPDSEVRTLIDFLDDRDEAVLGMIIDLAERD